MRRVQKSLFRKRIGNRLIALFLCALMAGTTVSCTGKAPEDSDAEYSVDSTEILYVPEYFDLKENQESLYLYGAVLNGEELCYRVSIPGTGDAGNAAAIRCVSLADGTSADIPLEFDVGYMGGWTVGEDGSVYLQQYVWNAAADTEDNSGSGERLVKYDRSGNRIYSQNISQFFTGEIVMDAKLAVDGKGRVCLFQEDAIRLFDASGNPAGDISLSSGTGMRVNVFCRGVDGKVYAAVTENNSTGSDATLYQVNFETKKLDAGQGGFPADIRNGLTQDASDSFLLNNGVSVVRYHYQSGEKEEILRWSDSGIDGNTVNAVNMLSDGRIAVLCQDWMNNKTTVALLSGVSRAEAPEKKEIVVAQLYPNPDLTAAAALFNKQSENYHVTVKNYVGFNADQEEAEAARTRLAAEIISGNGPDMLESTSLGEKKEQLVSQGAFVDLNPYLDSSTVLKRDDMVENVLESETYNGMLLDIPASFDIYTYMGLSDKLGKKMGWTYEDAINLLRENPDAELCDSYGKTAILVFCTDLNAYVDWERATCKFDCDEFRELVEFVGQRTVSDGSVFGNGGGGWPLLYEKLGNGEVLLAFTGISNFYTLTRMREELQGDVTVIGEPTTDGTAAGQLLIQSGLSILSQSKVKDGAWEFLEFYFSQGEDRYRYGFPNSWSKLNGIAADQVEVRRYEDGEPILIDGKPISKNGYPYVSTQEEIDRTFEVIRAAQKVASEQEEKLKQFIREEAEAFYQGQKSLDAVVDAIQRRASIYLSENK